MNIPNEILISLLLFINIYTAINFVVIYGFLNLKSNTNKKLNTTKYQTFSIVIAARNEAQNISHLIDNLLSQNYPKNLFEIIVVDDFSEDNTLLILEKYLQEKNIKISLNIDVYDILYKDFIEYLINFINANHISPKCLQFEILEEEDLYKYFDKIKIFVDSMKKIGCKIALDDFGKGYSNFALISRLNIDNLKIDMSLVKDIDKDNKSYEVLKFIINIAKILNIKTTTEGVENENIYNKLLELKPDFLQGYYFHKPSAIIDL